MNWSLISSCCINTLCCKSFQCKSAAVTLAHDLLLWPVDPRAPWLFTLPATATEGSLPDFEQSRATNQPADQLTSEPAIKPSSQPLSKPRSHSCSSLAPCPHQPNKTLIHLGRGPALLILSAPQSVVTTSLSCVLILTVPSRYHYPHTDAAYIRCGTYWHTSCLFFLFVFFKCMFFCKKHKRKTHKVTKERRLSVSFYTEEIIICPVKKNNLHWFQ